jgi:hypothetical protein
MKPINFMRIRNDQFHNESTNMRTTFTRTSFVAVSLFLTGVTLVSGAAAPEDSALPAEVEKIETVNAEVRFGQSPRRVEGADPIAQREFVVVQNQRPKPQPGGGQNQPGPGEGGGGGGGIGGVGGGVQGRQFNDRLQGIVHRGPGGGGKALVIRSSETDPKQQAETEEDLAVMSHILDKAAAESLGRESSGRKVMGIDVFFAPGASALRSFFLEGYGALFLVKVNLPLLAPPDKSTPPKEEQPVDSSWEEAKRELYGRKPDGKWEAGAREPYNEENVTKLKDALLEALKNGSNIRNLKSDDSITLCVFGGSGAGPFRWKSMVRKETVVKRGSGKDEPEVIVHNEEDGPAGGRGTIMTIRVKKSDVDAFGKGKLTLDEFRKKARIATYVGDVGGEGPMPFGFSEGGGGSGSFELR